MSDDAKHLRARAIDCRALAKSARNEIDATMLEDIAAELDTEARRIEAEAAAKERAEADAPESSRDGDPRAKARSRPLS